MLTEEEQEAIYNQLSRKPTAAEEATIDALWSEHCSYKSSKRWFHHFNTTSDKVYLGIGEGAGLLDVGGDWLIGIGLESHNHPSAVDPFNGAATGVGGIIRDILSQGCKPIAILDCLRFGYPTTNRQRLLLDQVVLGISSYGNCVGIPNLGGDVEFHSAFATNPLVNAMCVGIAKKDDIVRSIARNVGDVLLLFGSTTGRDGIGGVTFASEELDESQDESRGSIQIGDPLTEKILIDVVIKLRDEKLLNGLQDLGGGGLACAAIEMAEKGGNGVHLELEKVPKREEMQPWEILVSESQERMLAIVAPENVDKAIEIIRQHGLHYAKVGKVTEGDTFIGSHNETICAETSVDFVINGFPEPKRDLSQKPLPIETLTEIPTDMHFLEFLLSRFNVAAKYPVYEQYDHTVQGNTVIGPGRDAGIVLLPNGKYLAIAAGTNSYLVSMDPMKGAVLATLEIMRNVIVRGATPLGMVDSLNAGNPEKPSSYQEFVDIIKGIGEVSHKMSIPVVGGNVSLYNESEMSGETFKILPSPFVGIVGISETRPIPDLLLNENASILLIGGPEGILRGSEYSRYHPTTDQLTIDYEAEIQLMNKLHGLQDHILAATDVGRGGILVGLAKWAIQSNVGINLQDQVNRLSKEILYGENTPRYLIQVKNDSVEAVTKLLDEIPVTSLGKSTKDNLKFVFDKTWNLNVLRQIWESPLVNAMKL